MFKPCKTLYQTQQVRVLDKIAIEEFGIPGFTLMQKAGQALFTALWEHWPKAKKIALICGSGNNAGDGYVVARSARKAGLAVTIFYLQEPAKLTADALQAAQAAIRSKVPMRKFNPDEKIIADVVVDALLGTGLKGEVRAEYKAAISAINNSGLPVLAVDVPSGLDADSGNPLGVAVRAEVTVTFVGCKQGLFTGQAAGYCGKILFDDLDVPRAIYEKQLSDTELLLYDDFKPYLPKRKRTAHKGSFGHILIVGGDYGMGGAARMAGEAAARSGSGLTTVATRPEHVAMVSGPRPELMCYGVNSAKDLSPLLKRATVLVVGPGLGRSAWSQELLAVVLNSDKPKVIDADGLNLLAENPQKSDNWILTPHPGEASRLLNCATDEINQDRFSAIKALQSKYGGVCVLKGAGTLVLGLDGKIGVCSAGNPGMASGGMGDVLSGVIGGLLAQGLSLENSARLGVLLHSLAADLSAETGGERGLLATDLLPYLRKLVNNV